MFPAAARVRILELDQSFHCSGIQWNTSWSSVTFCLPLISESRHKTQTEVHTYLCHKINQTSCNGLTPAGKSGPFSSLLSPSWRNRGESQKCKAKISFMGWDKGSLIVKAKGIDASKAEPWIQSPLPTRRWVLSHPQSSRTLSHRRDAWVEKCHHSQCPPLSASFPHFYMLIMMLLVHPQCPRWWGGMRSRKGSDYVQVLLSNSKFIPGLSTLFPAKIQNTATMKKFNSASSNASRVSKKFDLLQYLCDVEKILNKEHRHPTAELYFMLYCAVWTFSNCSYNPETALYSGPVSWFYQSYTNSKLHRPSC